MLIVLFQGLCTYNRLPGTLIYPINFDNYNSLSCWSFSVVHSIKTGLQGCLEPFETTSCSTFVHVGGVRS